MMKKLLFLGIVAGGICFFPTRGYTLFVWFPNPLHNAIFGGDPITSIVGTVANMIAAAQDPEMGATANVEQEERAALEAGDTKYVKAELSGTATSQGFETTAYAYLNEKSMTGSEKTPYTYFNERLGGLTFDSAKDLVVDRFFIKNADDLTTENQEKVKKLRTEYLQTIGTQYALLAQEVQTKLAADVESVKSTSFNGNGVLGALSGVDQTWIAAVRALMADIALQLQLLELDAARFLNDQPIEILSKPADADSGSSS